MIQAGAGVARSCGDKSVSPRWGRVEGCKPLTPLAAALDCRTETAESRSQLITLHRDYRSQESWYARFRFLHTKHADPRGSDAFW